MECLTKLKEIFDEIKEHNNRMALKDKAKLGLRKTLINYLVGDGLKVIAALKTREKPITRQVVFWPRQCGKSTAAAIAKAKTYLKDLLSLAYGVPIPVESISQSESLTVQHVLKLADLARKALAELEKPGVPPGNWKIHWPGEPKPEQIGQEWT